jgi:hypothetical protein
VASANFMAHETGCCSFSGVLFLGVQLKSNAMIRIDKEIFIFLILILPVKLATGNKLTGAENLNLRVLLFKFVTLSQKMMIINTVFLVSFGVLVAKNDNLK